MRIHHEELHSEIIPVSQKKQDSDKLSIYAKFAVLVDYLQGLPSSIFLK